MTGMQRKKKKKKKNDAKILTETAGEKKNRPLFSSEGSLHLKLETKEGIF